ncbi:U-box domain-containing protein 19-like [Nicotiana sylvestris]|uniref:RING-type E3 ubiquitin transferase n=1 Tax=Nicotiana sylvestris TaxID=4096 RepID=A0A1U7XXJ6_NICSY|nr:PREDICTED: U-box domain-containing protein 19-like [Nicotiana sylvestris]
MIQRFDRNDRRILTFPAVHPCENISPATLLDSLITLSRNICNFKSKFFATQRKNVRETIRQVGILLIFFEEIRDNLPSIRDSIILCFAELHTTFQKLKFLLDDCTREGARTWMLMKSHSVASQFRALIRTVATALDVLPLNSLNISREIKELVIMVANQAQRAKMELDPEDEDAMKRVILIMNQFENKFEPDTCISKKVLDYLNITTWAQCHKETKFLEEEINFECSENYEREVPMLSSLVGFLSYCRGILFEDSVYGNTDQSDGASNLEALTCLNPEDFRCPISLELMTDPVTVSTGQTYDRVSIQRWLKSGNLLCPKTGEILQSTELLPNSTLRKLIQQFCADNGISLAKSRKKNRDISRTIFPGSPAAAEAIKFLSEFLASRLYFGSDQQIIKAAYEIRLLAKSNIFNRSVLIEAASIPALLQILNTNDPIMQENSISALLKLSKHSNGKKVIMENGGLKLIISVLKDGLKVEAKQIAAAIIFYISSPREYRKAIGENPEVFPALVELIKDGTSCGKKNAIVAIFGLLLSHRNHERALGAGTVPALVDLLASSDKVELNTDALAVLASLAEKTEGSFAILEASALPVILSQLQNITSRAGKEYCVSILLYLCINCGAEVLAALVREQALMPLLYSLLTEGTSQAKKRTRSLIKILQKFCETSTSRFVSEVPQEQFIDVR